MEENRTDKTDYTLLSLIDKSAEPLGCWTLTELARINELPLSTSSIGRKLKEFDVKGYTVKSGNKGRILTQKGKEYVAIAGDFIQREKLRNAAVEAATANNALELKQLLIVRKCLETEIAYQAALNATEEEKAKLKEAHKAHKETVMLGNDPTDTALQFHMTLAVICHNRLLRRLMRLIIFEENSIENNMEELVTRERGEDYILDHEEILNAVLDSNPDKAKMEMDQHIQKLIDAVSEDDAVVIKNRTLNKASTK